MPDSEEEAEAENEDRGPYLGEYEGERNEKDERHGQGKTLLPNRDVYEGQYLNGKRDGAGLYRFKNKLAKGARYTGDYFQGRKQGNGVFFYPDGSKYEGHWLDDLKDGTGKYTYPNGDRYDGEWSRGYRHGKGTYTFSKDGTKYKGSWRKGKMEGFGELQYPNYKYCGRFRDNKMFGHGKYVFDTACELHGQYVISDQEARLTEMTDLETEAMLVKADGDDGEEGEDAPVLRLPPSPPPIGPTHWVSGVLTGLHVMTPEEEEEARLVADLNKLRAKVEAQILAKKEAQRRKAEARAAKRARKEAERAAWEAQASEAIFDQEEEHGEAEGGDVLGEEGEGEDVPGEEEKEDGLE